MQYQYVADDPAMGIATTERIMRMCAKGHEFDALDNQLMRIFLGPRYNMNRLTNEQRTKLLSHLPQLYQDEVDMAEYLAKESPRIQAEAEKTVAEYVREGERRAAARQQMAS